MKKLFPKTPSMLSEALQYTKKYPIFAIGVFIWFVLLFFVLGTSFSNIIDNSLNKKVTYKVGYCITYISGATDTLRYEFKGKTNVPFESYLSFNSNGCVINYENVIVACGVRKVEWLYTHKWHPIKKK